MFPYRTGVLAHTGYEKLPRDLRICFTHDGGSFAFCSARYRRDITREGPNRTPSYYFDRFYADSADFDGACLTFLVEMMGEDHMMLGFDSRFPVGEEHVGKTRANHAGIRA